jgi:hypothetical protein
VLGSFWRELHGMFCEFILGRTSWNVYFGSSFWRELHGMYVLGVHFGKNFMECMFCKFILKRELHGMYVLRVHFGENFMECMFCEFILERTSGNVCFASSFWRELHGMFCSLKHAWLLDGIIN